MDYNTLSNKFVFFTIIIVALISVAVMFGIAINYQVQNKYIEATEIAAITTTADAFDFHYQKGLGYMNVGRWEEARQEFELIFEADPDYRNVQTKLKEVYAKITELKPVFTSTPVPLPTPTSVPSPTDIFTPTTSPTKEEIFSSNLPNELIAYYPFNGNANDESGKGHHGTVYGAELTADRNGTPNSAYSFDGIDDYILIQDNDALDLPNISSICSWFQVIRGNNHVVVSKYQSDTPSESGYIIATNEHTLRMWIKDSFGSGVFNIPDYEFTIGEWIFACLVIDDGNVKGYINGEYLGTAPARLEQVFGNPRSVLIGGSYNLASRVSPLAHFAGIIDEVRLYTYALTKQEIQNLYLSN